MHNLVASKSKARSSSEALSGLARESGWPESLALFASVEIGICTIDRQSKLCDDLVRSESPVPKG